MVLATDDTSISVPHEKCFPGSQALYEEYIAALDKDFKSHDGSVGFVAKGSRPALLLFGAIGSLVRSTGIVWISAVEFGENGVGSARSRSGGEVGVDEARGLNDVGGDSTHVEDNLSRLGLIDADADELGGEAFGDEANGAIVGLP
jgi:hypothetical protein